MDEKPDMIVKPFTKREIFSDTWSKPSGEVLSLDMRAYAGKAGSLVGEEVVKVSPLPDDVRAAPPGATFTIEREAWRYLGVPIEIDGETVRFLISRAAAKQRIEVAVE